MRLESEVEGCSSDFSRHDLRNGFAHEPERAVNLSKRQPFLRKQIIHCQLDLWRHRRGREVRIEQSCDVFTANRKTLNELQDDDRLGDTEMQGIIDKLETSFLKESLFRLSNECRLGKTCEYEKREYKYQDQGQGSLEDFFGRELFL